MKIVLIISGMLCVGLGFLGVFLPLLPTTPFLLLALFLFSRSSPEYSRKIITNKLLGPYVAGYISGEGIPMKVKWWSIAILWASILSSAVFFTENRAVRILLIIIAIGVTVHISMKKTASK